MSIIVKKNAYGWIVKACKYIENNISEVVLMYILMYLISFLNEVIKIYKSFQFPKI